MAYGFLCILIVCLVRPSLIYCDKFVVFLAQSRSHVYPLLPVVREMEKYNHSVKLVLSSAMKQTLLTDGISVPVILSGSLEQSSFIETIGAVSENKMLGSTITPSWNLLKESNALCHDFMADNELYKTLASENFDYAIVDFSPTLCFEVLAYKLSLPFVFIGAYYDKVLNRLPSNPSYIPAFFTSFTDKMTFMERVVNSFIYAIHLIRPSMPSFQNLVAIYAPEKPFLTNYELRKTALLHIVDGDILLDYALPLSPNLVFCGGLGTSAAKPLPKFIQTFVDKSIKGVVIVSFGSIIKRFPDEFIGKLMNTFQNMKHLSFIMKYGQEVKETGNVLILPWLPQNDLLGHPKTRLFITHCGKGGLFEALYHGIPVIGFPLGMDQEMNAAIVEAKGYGIKVDVLDFSIIKLKTYINQVALTQRYREDIQKASDIFHSRPQSPSQRAAYWINLVTKYGSAHFRPSSLDLPWYSYYMLDVISFYLSFVFVFIVTCLKCFKCVKTTRAKEKTD